jgi:hypothetical protein
VPPCLAIKLRVCFRNHSLSRLRCSGVASAYGWVTVLLYCLWLNKHIQYSNKGQPWIEEGSNYSKFILFI